MASLTFSGMEPHNGRISKLDVLTTIPSGNDSLPTGLHRLYGILGDKKKREKDKLGKKIQLNVPI